MNLFRLEISLLFNIWFTETSIFKGANRDMCDKREEWQENILYCEEVKDWKNSPQMWRMKTEASGIWTKMTFKCEASSFKCEVTHSW